jgi:teichuronic acid biosynthesis glycosyltransferase TuaH
MPPEAIQDVHAEPTDPSEPGLLPPTVSVTIVNHRSRDLLRTCLLSLRRFPYTLGTTEIVVLDNASGDGSVEMLHEDFPEVFVLAEHVRRGYAANQNRAVAASHGEVVFMLNPDATVHQHTIDHLVEALQWQDRVAIAGGPIGNADGSLRQDRPHAFPTPRSPYERALGVQRLRSQRPMPAGVIRDGWPSGGAYLIVRRAFDEVGGFDEDFFMYSEDADLFLRLVAHGNLIAWVPNAIVTHPFRDEPAETSARRETEIVTAELQYMQKHFGGTLTFRTGVVIDSAIRLAALSLPPISGFVKQHGKTTGYNRRVQRARLRAAVGRNGRPGLGDLARDWNRQHARANPQVDDGPDAVPTSLVGGSISRKRALPGLIVFDSSTTWDGPWMAFQHIALHLATRAPVLFVDSPWSPVYSYRTNGRPLLRSQLSRLSDNLYRLIPVAPPGLTRPGINRLTAVAVRRAVARAISELDADVHAYFCSLSAANLFDVTDADIRVYYASDDFVAGAELMGRPTGRIRQLDAELASQADAIVAISPAIANSYRARGYDPIVVPNGVESAAFAEVENAPLPTDVTLPSPIAGYIGHISDRMDLSLIEAIAENGMSLLLIGPRQITFGEDERLQRLLARPNVQWVGSKPFDELASYLRVIDVGLLPYTDSDFNRASFPLKTLEYLASGRPVVATRLPAVEWLDTDLITIAKGPAEFARRTSDEARTTRSPDLVKRRRAFAATHSWGKRVEQLAEILQIGAP